MIKSIIKEIIILIIIIAITIFALGIIFYEYFLDSSPVPSKLKAYTLENEINEELKQSIDEYKNQNILITYTVDSKDLEYYENTNQYNPGKVNPFSSDLLYTNPIDKINNNSTNNNIANNKKNNIQESSNEIGPK